jgi:hypothetical protein
VLNCFAAKIVPDYMEADEEYYTETPTNEKTPSSSIAGSKSGNVASLEHDKAAKTGGTSLYNPILPAKPGDAASSNNVNGSGVSSASAYSESAAEKSQSQRGAVKSEDMSDTAASQTNGSKPKSSSFPRSLSNSTVCLS